MKEGKKERKEGKKEVEFVCIAAWYRFQQKFDINT